MIDAFSLSGGAAAGVAPLQVRRLAIGYPGHRVGRDISLDLHKGEVLCLLGPNGSGKSTLFRTLMGLLPMRSGQVLLHGRPLSDWSRGGLARRMAYVPQAQADAFPFTVEDVVLMGRLSHLGVWSSPGRADRQHALQCLIDMGVASLRRRAYTDISGGERQLVLIARALAQEADIIIMDEPTASLDFGNQIRVLEYVRSLRERGLAILLCTHQPEHALSVADRVALFRRGRIHDVGPPRPVVTLQRLAWLYDLDVETVRDMLANRITDGHEETQ